MSNSNKHLITLHGVHAMRASHPAARRIKRQQSGHRAHGNKVWLSSFVLLDYLFDNPLPIGCRALDLGCGWGFSSAFMAKQFGADVTAVDIDDSVEPFVRLQCDINDTQVRFKRNRFEKMSGRELGLHHTIIGADICFWDELADTLYNLVCRALRSGSQQIIIADPGRPPFWALAERAMLQLNGRRGITVEIISRRVHTPIKTEKYLLKISLQSLA